MYRLSDIVFFEKKSEMLYRKETLFVALSTQKGEMGKQGKYATIALL